MRLVLIVMLALMLGSSASGATPEAEVVAAGSFVHADPLVQPRRHHSATRLADGRVMVVGGEGRDGRSRSTVEIWDSATNSWALADPMAQGRSHHTATLLADSGVLVIGGTNKRGRWGRRTSELWDPTSHSFARSGSMATPRAYHEATLLADGRVLVTGGYLFDSDIDDEPALLVTAELWEPEAGAFSATGEMTAPHSSHDAVLLEDGRVLIPPERVELGDCYAESCHIATAAEFWDPLDGRFSPLELNLHGHNGGTATRLADGRVLIVGGVDVEMLGGDGGLVGNALIYDPETGMFEPTGGLIEKRNGHTATLLADGRVLVVGGWDERSESTATAELYDPALGSFISAGSMSRARSGHTATLLSDGRVLIAGGSGRRGPMAGVELWVPGGEADSLGHSP